MRYLVFLLLLSASFTACSGGEADEGEDTPSETVVSTPVETTSAVLTITASSAPTQVPATATPTTSVDALQANMDKLEEALTGLCGDFPCYQDPQGAFSVLGMGGTFEIDLNKSLPSVETASAVLSFLSSIGIQDHCDPVLPIIWGASGSEGIPFCTQS